MQSSESLCVICTSAVNLEPLWTVTIRIRRAARSSTVVTRLFPLIIGRNPNMGHRRECADQLLIQIKAYRLGQQYTPLTRDTSQERVREG
jgi:hypothetical protein